MDDDERRARVERLIKEIKALKIGATGDDASAVRRLRSDKVMALAERLSHPGELPPDYSMSHLVRRIDSLAARHSADLLNSPDHTRAERIAGAPGDDDLNRMTAMERLDHANRLAHLFANTKKREDVE